MTSRDGIDAADVLAALEEIYAQIKRVHRELAPTDRIVADLGVDSLATLELLLALEERFGIKLLDNPAVARVDTIADLVALITEVAAPTTASAT